MGKVLDIQQYQKLVQFRKLALESTKREAEKINQDNGIWVPSKDPFSIDDFQRRVQEHLQARRLRHGKI